MEFTIKLSQVLEIIVFETWSGSHIGMIEVRNEPLLESNPKAVEVIPNLITQAETRYPGQQEVKVEENPKTIRLETSGLVQPTIAVRKSQRNTTTPSKFKDYVLGK